MTEEEARAWIARRYGESAEERLDHFRTILVSESAAQNLIAPSTFATIWSRHLLDSVQLLDHAPRKWRHWVDIGSGAGLPGIVIATLCDQHVTLIEPRRLRVDFLNLCRERMGLTNVSIIRAKAETADVPDQIDVVSARAVAKLDTIFAVSAKFSTTATVFILPKGTSAKSEVAAAKRSWQGMFHVEQSIVDPDSGIVVATQVARR